MKWRFEQFEVSPSDLKYKSWSDFKGIAESGEDKLTVETFIDARKKALEYCFGSSDLMVLENRQKYLIVHKHLQDGKNLIIVGGARTGKTLIAALVIKEVTYACRIHNINLTFKCIKSAVLQEAARWDNLKPVNHDLLDDWADIDFLIITTSNTLWTTRLFTYAILFLFRIKTRRPNKEDEKDKVCLNIWLDEDDLVWSKDARNAYTAHEIGQIVPLVNKNFTYENFINKNIWIKDYWPNAAGVGQRSKIKDQSKSFSLYYVLCSMFEPIARWFQLAYMRKKVTREVVSKTRAIFHPIDWSKHVLSKLSG